MKKTSGVKSSAKSLGGEQFYSILLNSSPNPILLVNLDLRVVYVNPAMEKATGYSASELMGYVPPYPWWTSDEMLLRFQTRIRQADLTGIGVRGEERLFRRKNGEMFWVQINSARLNLPGSGKVVLVTWVDVTQRKEAEQSLRQSEETARTLLNSFTELAILIDLKGTVLAVNKAGARQLGAKVEALVGTDLFSIFPPGLATTRYEQVLKATLKRKSVRFEDEAGGRVYENDVRPVLDAWGNVVRLAVFARDITERRAARNRIRNVYRELVTAIPFLLPVEQSQPLSVISPREKEVLRLIAEGKSTAAIAKELSLSRKTVETHRYHVLHKLELGSNAELTKFAVREGLSRL